MAQNLHVTPISSSINKRSRFHPDSPGIMFSGFCLGTTELFHVFSAPGLEVLHKTQTPLEASFRNGCKPSPPVQLGLDKCQRLATNSRRMKLLEDAQKRSTPLCVNVGKHDDKPRNRDHGIWMEVGISPHVVTGCGSRYVQILVPAVHPSWKMLEVMDVHPQNMENFIGFPTCVAASIPMLAGVIHLVW